jgi:DNA-binding IclR family transcriptional regulator
MNQSQGVIAVNRALSILDAFKSSNGYMTLNEIANATGFYKSTTLRLLASLEQYGYVRRLDRGGYHIGPKAAELGAIYQSSFNLRDYVLPVLHNIVDATDESASFYVRDRESRLCLFRIETTQLIRDHIREGDVLPLDQGASGKVLSRYETGMPDRIAPDDYVLVSLGERQADMAASAAPVFGTGGRLVGALNISGPRTRFTSRALKKIDRILRKSATELSVSLGAPRESLPAV